MQCSKPIWIEKQKIQVPCLKCRSCRIARSREWTMRLTHEWMSMGMVGMFLTLTYSDEHIPTDYSLKKYHLQNFIKSLRYRLDKHGKKIKHYSVGEYGEETSRPHYHCIILGVSCSSVLARRLVCNSWRYCDWTNRRTQASIGTVTSDSMRYVTDYVQKKFTHPCPVVLNYHYQGRQPPFQLQSQGIGRDFIMSNKSNLEKIAKVRYRDKMVGLPRYYKNKLNCDRLTLERNRFQALEKMADKFGVDMDDLKKRAVLRLGLNDEQYINGLQVERNLKAKEDILSSKKL